MSNDEKKVILNTKIPTIGYESETESPFKKKSIVYNGMTISELMGKEKPEEDKAFVIIQDGGMGDAICSTAMVESAKKFYPDKKIVVGSTYSEMFLNNPNVDALYSLYDPKDLFEKWVKPLKHFGSVIKRDIYNACAHKLFPGPLSMIWCYLYGVPFHGDNIKVYLTDEENKSAQDYLNSFPRKVIIIHPTGAKLNFNPDVQITPNKDWFFEYWDEVVAELTKKYDVIQIGGRNEEQIPGVTTYLLGGCSPRQSLALVKNCLTYVGVDSFIVHGGAAVGKKGIGLYGRSNPFIAGHEINTNLWVEGSCEFNDLGCGRPMGYYGDQEIFRGVQRGWVCPRRSCMRAIKPKDVLKAINDIINEELKETTNVKKLI